jgi:hypothetical protein
VKRSPAFVAVLFVAVWAAQGQQTASWVPEFPGPPSAPVAHPMLAGSYGPEPLAGDQRPNEPYPANISLAPWSRMSVGADISPLGIGVKGTIDMNTYMDLRANFDIFRFSPGRFEVEGFNTYANIQLTSLAAMYDVYPWNSVWRLSAGVMLYNNNQVSGNVDIAPGTQFTLDGQNFYSAKTNPVTGATPLVGGGALGFHRDNPALILTSGFGKFIPRSYRHWSFPAEFGVIFTGGPTINTHESGWVCSSVAETECANLSDPTNPVTIQFNNALNAQLSKWRRTFNDVPVYPVFAYSVVYSFNIHR